MNVLHNHFFYQSIVKIDMKVMSFILFKDNPYIIFILFFSISKNDISIGSINKHIQSRYH